jgi:hypothetical protein
LYVFHPGYWAAHVGYYGGINYGFGYAGVGFTGGRWEGNAFAYNSAVSNLNSSIIHNTYRDAPVGNSVVSKVSYNGGPGGLTTLPTAEERLVASEPHIPATPLQHRNAQQAAGSPTRLVRAEVGHPALATVGKPVAANTQRAATHTSAAKPVAPPPAAVRTVATDPSEPAPHPNEAVVRPVAQKAGPAASKSSQHAAH